MSEVSPATCRRCGAALTGAAGGLCPRCLMAEAMQPTQDGDAAMAQPPLAPTEIAPHFPQLEILECLGRGGMGVVYKARQKSLNRLVALKLLAPERADDPQFAARFEKEAQALATLNHPHIVSVYDFGRAGGFYYLLMEFVDGVNLRQLLRARQLSPREALAIVPPICDALQCAHDHGIVHRDIKPENLLMNRTGGVKIADFGIAKMVRGSAEASTDESAVGAASSGHSAGAGTPDYAAPEQRAAHGAVDHRADIYSLGVVLYEMLTGERPAQKIEPPSKRVQVDVRIDEVVLRALEPQPERRYQTAVEMRTHVESLAAESKSREFPTAGWGHFVGMIFGLKFTSRLAFQIANLSALGFLGFLGFVPLPGWQRCFGFSGFFGLIGLAFLVEIAGRRSRAATVALAVTLALVIGVVTSVGWGYFEDRRSRELSSNGETPAAFAQRGWQLWQSGRPAEALPIFREVVKRTPDDANAWNGLGWAAFNSGKVEEALAAFQKVLALDPQHMGALNGLGQIYFSRREYEKAEPELLKAAQQGASASWYGLARLYLLQGRFEDAEKWAQMVDDSGQGDAIATKMLEAAKARRLSEGLRAMLEPHEPASAATSPKPNP